MKFIFPELYSHGTLGQSCGSVYGSVIKGQGEFPDSVPSRLRYLHKRRRMPITESDSPGPPKKEPWFAVCVGRPGKETVLCESKEAPKTSDDGMPTKGNGCTLGVDKCWGVVVLAFFMTTMESASSRSSGFLYIGIMEEMNVDHGLASWPVSLIGSLIDCGGLVAGPLSEVFTTVPVLVAGSGLASVSVIAAAFAPNITWLTVTLGVMHGFGLGVVITMLQIIVTMYFDRYRGAANGIMFAGSTVSGLFFPQLLLFLKNTYDFRRSLLLFGAILMNMFALSLAFREPPWVQRQMTRRKHSMDARRPSLLTIEPVTTVRPETSTSQTLLQNVSAMLRSLMFYVLVCTWLGFCYNYDIFFSTIVDLAMDKDISEEDAVELIPYASITDLVGRVLLPILADRKYLQPSTLMMLNYLLLGVAVASLPFTRSYEAVLTSCLCISLFLGCGITMQSVLMAQYLGLERLAVGYSCMGAICGPALLGKAPFVGFFKDDLGSYHEMFWVLGGLSIFVSILWAFVTFIGRWKTRQWNFDTAKSAPGMKDLT
ncbi:monocarboxylate transporter 12-like isoform X2 [Amblyomma americanum]